MITHYFDCPDCHGENRIEVSDVLGGQCQQMCPHCGGMMTVDVRVEVYVSVVEVVANGPVPS